VDTQGSDGAGRAGGWHTDADPHGWRKYLKRWGFTPQELAKRAYEQNPKAVRRWLDEDIRKSRRKRSRRMQRFTGEMRQEFVVAAAITWSCPEREDPGHSAQCQTKRNEHD